MAKTELIPEKIKQAESGFYRVYGYNETSAQPWVHSLEYIGGGYYNAEKEGTPAEQIVKWIQQTEESKKTGFLFAAGTYFAVAENYVNGTYQTSFYVEPLKPQEITYG